MHRLGRAARAMPMPSIASRRRITPISSQMHPYDNGYRYATSSPKASEEASAESGSSGSKDVSGGEKEGLTGAMPDSLSDRPAKGRTGGGKPLGSSKNAPPQPKILNASVTGDGENMTEDQRKEVEEHNKSFEQKHDRASPAAGDKVDKNFWSGGGSR